MNSTIARSLITECLSAFGRNNVKIVRLDAVGYVVKKVGTSCFFVEPQIFEFLDWLKGIADILRHHTAARGSCGPRNPTQIVGEGLLDIRLSFSRT